MLIVHSHTRAYVDYFGMEEIQLQHRQHDGSMGPVLNRNSLMQGSAVVVLPYDPVQDTVILVEQFRPPCLPDRRPRTLDVGAGGRHDRRWRNTRTGGPSRGIGGAQVTLDALEYAGGPIPQADLRPSMSICMSGLVL